MKKLLILIALCWASVSQANIIELSTDAYDVSTNETHVLEIRLVDFETFDFLTFSIDFDTTLLGFTGVTSSDIDIVDLANLQFFGVDAVPTLDGVGISVSGMPFPVPTTYMGSFLLATLEFSALATGQGTFTPKFGSTDAFALSFVPITTAPTFNTAADVNEPAAWLLVAMAIAVVVIRRRG